MKILKRILIVLVIIIAIPLIAALFMKKDYSVERKITINKSKQDVFNYVKLLKNQANYSKWAKMDPNAKTEFRGNDGTVGFVSSWDSNMKDVGKGEQEISNITEGERIDYKLHFIKPFDSKATAYLITNILNENQTEVKWGFEGKMPYPMNIMMPFMNMDKMIGSDLDTGLSNLKTLMEK